MPEDSITIDLPIPVSSLAELTNANELETQIVAQTLEGIDDQVIAQQLTAQGY